jgi:protein TonB
MSPVAAKDVAPAVTAQPELIGNDGGAPEGSTPLGSGPAGTAGDRDERLLAIREKPQLVPLDSRPSLTEPLRVRYPAELAARRAKGTVTLWVLVNASGGVEEARILHSSGHLELDEAAMQAIRSASYIPGRRAGLAVPAWLQQRVWGVCCRTGP